MNNEQFELMLQKKRNLIIQLSENEQAQKSMIEFAFFDLYNSFLNNISNYFNNYAIGEKSDNGYFPERKLLFENMTQFHAFIKNGRDIVDYQERIKALHAHIFFPPSPFEIYTSKTYSQITEMKIIRDYIAHRSDRAKEKYVASFCKAGPFIEPSDLLSKRSKKTGKTYFDECTKTMQDALNFVYSPFI